MRSFPLLPSSRSRLTDELRAACREEMRAEIKRTIDELADAHAAVCMPASDAFAGLLGNIVIMVF